MNDRTSITGEVQFEDVVIKTVLERKPVQKIIGTTPNVLNVEFLELNNTEPTTITDFLKGTPSQRLHILGDGFSTVEHGVLIFTNTGENKLLESNKVYRFTYFTVEGPPKSHKWVEDA